MLPFLHRMYSHFLTKGLPTLYTTTIFLVFCLFEAVLAMVLPGPHVKGLPIPHEGGRQLDYKCNGVISLYTTYLVSAVLHYSGLWRLTEVFSSRDSLFPLPLPLFSAPYSFLVFSYPTRVPWHDPLYRTLLPSIVDEFAPLFFSFFSFLLLLLLLPLLPINLIPDCGQLWLHHDSGDHHWLRGDRRHLLPDDHVRQTPPHVRQRPLRHLHGRHPQPPHPQPRPQGMPISPLPSPLVPFLPRSLKRSVIIRPAIPHLLCDLLNSPNSYFPSSFLSLFFLFFSSLLFSFLFFSLPFFTDLG